MFFDYKSFPLWLYDENGVIFRNGLPEEWENDENLKNGLKFISSLYDRLFIDNEFEFRFEGFKSPEERKNFFDSVNSAVQLLEKRNNGKYPIEYELEVES